MPASKHRRRRGAKAVRHPGRTVQLPPPHALPDDGATRVLLLRDGRRVADAETRDLWLSEVREIVARNPPTDIDPAAALRVAEVLAFLAVPQ
jgi:hypothetical protein